MRGRDDFKSRGTFLEGPRNKGSSLSNNILGSIRVPLH